MNGQVERAKVAQVYDFFRQVIAMRRNKVWMRAHEDLETAVKVVSLALTAATTRTGRSKDSPFRLKLEPENPDLNTRLNLVLNIRDERIVLDTFVFDPEGCYPIRLPAEDGAPVVLESPEALALRILGHFGNPKSHLAELIERHAP